MLPGLLQIKCHLFLLGHVTHREKHHCICIETRILSFFFFTLKIVDFASILDFHFLCFFTDFTHFSRFFAQSNDVVCHGRENTKNFPHGKTRNRDPEATQKKGDFGALFLH